MFGFTFSYGALFTKVWIAHRRRAQENYQIAAVKKKDEVFFILCLLLHYNLKNLYKCIKVF